MKKKLLSIILVLALSTTMLAGCGTKEPADPAPNAGTEDKTDDNTPVDEGVSYEVTEPITIKWWHALEDQYAGTVEKVVTGFNNSQDLITVEAEYVGSYAEVNEALVAAHAAGTGLPGVVVANTPYVAEYGASGLTENLDPYIEAAGIDMNDFGLGLIESTSYDNKQVSFPFLISTQIMYYNKDMATELGVTVPTQIDDMDEFLKSVSKVSANGETDVYGTIIPGWDQWYFETFYLNKGVNIINEDGISTDLGGPESIEMTKQIQDWCDKGYAYWASGQDASSIMRQHFIDGEAFSVLHTSSLYNTYVDRCDFEVGMAWYPGDKTNTSEIGGSVLLIPSKNDQDVKNASFKFLEYLVSEEVNMTWAIETGYLPTRKSVLDTEEADKFLEEKPAFKVIFDNIDLINPRIQHKAWSPLAEIWKSYMAETIIEGLDVDTQLEHMADEINEVLEDQ